MNTKRRYWKYVVFLFCAVLMFGMGACQTAKNQPRKSSKYQRVRTRHTPKWNATTSQTTTYYIKKHSTRKSHDGKKLKYDSRKKKQSHEKKRNKR